MDKTTSSVYAAQSVRSVDDATLIHSHEKPFWKRKHGWTLFFHLSASFLASFIVGFDGSQTGAMQFLPIWQRTFGDPTGSTLGLFGAANSVGGLISLLFFGWVTDYFGRRFPTAVGSVVVIVGALIEFFAKSLNVFIGGKLVVGLGSSFVQLGAPILIAELSHPKERVKLTSLYSSSIFLGYAIGAWITFGCVHISSAWQWRLPTLLQVIPSLYQLFFIYLSPESPRWLIKHGKEYEARQILIKYHGEDDEDAAVVQQEMEEIKTAQTREAELHTTWSAFLSRANFKRLFLCTAGAVFSQTTGNLLISNYLAQILKRSGIESAVDSTLINAMLLLWSYACSIAMIGLIDRFRRRTLFLAGSSGNLIVFVVWTVCAQQFIENESLAAGHVIIACIFVFQAFHTLAWLNVVVAYCLEVATYRMRAKTWAYFLVVIYTSQIFGNYVNPVALDKIGWYWYIYYCIWNLCIVIMVYFFFIETRGPSLENVAYIFDGNASDGPTVNEDAGPAIQLKNVAVHSSREIHS